LEEGSLRHDLLSPYADGRQKLFNRTIEIARLSL
jgi:hypothetical protein